MICLTCGRSLRLGAALLTLLSTGLTAAESVEQFDFDLQAQPLAQALEAFAQTTRRQVIANSSDLAGLRSPALSGRYSAPAALSVLLADAPLKVTSINGIDFSLKGATNDPPTTTPPMPTAELDEIVVYGTKQNRDLQQTQTSVALYTPQRFDEEVLFSLDDILLRTANVSASNVQTSFALRGINQGGVGNAGTGRTANVYVDGAPLSFDAQQGVQSLWDVEQVEVHLGPQSTVQGRNALAGAIVMQTKDPTYDWEFLARGQVASEETRRGSFAVGGPLVDNQLAFRLAYDNQTYDAEVVEVISGIPQEFQDSELIRGKLLFEPAALPDLRVELIAESVVTDFGEFNTRFAPVAFDDPAFSDYDPFGTTTFTRVRLEQADTQRYIADITYDLTPSWDLIALLTYEDNTRTIQFGTPVGNEVSLINTPTEFETYSAELRAAFSFDRLSGWIGAYYFEDERFNALSFSIPLVSVGIPADPPNSVAMFETLNVQQTDNQALFAELNYDFNETWSVTLGARYDEEEFFNSGDQGSVTIEPANCVAAIPNLPPLPCGVLFAQPEGTPIPADFEAFLPRGTLTYRFDEDRSLSFSVQRGYRAGGASQRVVPGEGISEIIAFDPEFVTNYEVAFRSRWLDGRLTANANAFYMDWEDQQVSILGPSGAAQDVFVDNAGESKLYGLEFNLEFAVSSQLRMFTSLGLLDTEFTDFAFALVPGEFENLAGNEFPTAPGVTAAAGFSYESDAGFYSSLSASYRGSQQSDVTNLAVNEVGSATLVNGRVGYRGKGWNVYAFANNLLDERFSTSKVFANVNTGTGAVVTQPNARFQVNEPRIVGVGVEFRY
ncbi:MAG: TonB-dependent receptor [Pseudomonadota bacterium]